MVGSRRVAWREHRVGRGWKRDGDPESAVRRLEGERGRDERGKEGAWKGVGKCGGGCRFAKRGLPLGCFARGVVGRVYGRGMEVSLQSLGGRGRVSSAPRCRPFSLASMRVTYLCALCEPSCAANYAGLFKSK